MAYVTLAALKEYLDIDEAGDDATLTGLITDAQKIIDNHTHRTFEAVTQTRYFDRSYIDPWDSFVLWMDNDLLTITTLTNGDSDGTAIPNTEYWLTNGLGKRAAAAPYHGIRLKVNSTYSWEFDTDYWVSVAGTWGYTTEAPNAIQIATKRLAAYLYRQRDTGQFDTVQVYEGGRMFVPGGFPSTVEELLKPYVRQGVA